MIISKKNTADTLSYLKGTLHAYMAAKEEINLRIQENSKWYKAQHWSLMHSKNDKEKIEPTSAYIFNAIANKHADAMDNYPTPVVLPREPKDKAAADILTTILPYVLERSSFRQIYSRNWWYKLKNGSASYAVIYNPHSQNIEISRVDLLNMYWEPGIDDIQKSKFLFVLSVADIKETESKYPHAKGKLSSEFKLFSNGIDISEKCVIVDCYYKSMLENGKTAVHIIKFCGDAILDCSQSRESTKDFGIYNHGMYPFVIDSLYPDEGTPMGFGIIDIAKNPQMYIDKLDQIISQNALISGKVRWLVKDNGGVNEEELLDLSQDVVHVAGSINNESIKEFQAHGLDAYIAEHRQNKISELKEIVGNRDIYSGGNDSGAVAYGAIVALQEAANKISRDMLFEGNSAYISIIQMLIELIAQFYDKKRIYRITGQNGDLSFMEFDNSALGGNTMFDISVRAEQNNALSREAVNQLAIELFKCNFFDKNNKEAAILALEMMNFEGKSTIINMLKSI